MNIGNLGGFPSQPGDTVRDRQTGQDYVIQSIGTAAIVGGLSISLIHLYDHTVHNLTYGAEHDWTQAYSVIKVNINNDLPDTVIKKVQNTLSDIFGSNQELLDKIKLPENGAIRDLLLLSSESTPELFKSNLVSLAETLVGTSGKIPSTSVVRNILEDAAEGTGRTADFLDDLSAQIVKQSQLKAGLNGIKQLSSSASDFLSYKELQIAHKFNLTGSRPYQVSAEQQQVIDYIFGPKSSENIANIRDIPFFQKAFGLNPGESSESLRYATRVNQQKISRVVKQIFSDDNQISQTLENYIDRAIRVGANEQGDVRYNNILRFILENIDTDTMYQIKNRMGKTAVSDAQNSRGIYQGLAGSYGRKTAIGRDFRDLSGLRGSIDFKAVATGLDSDPTSMVSLDIPTFTELLGDRSVTIGGTKYRNIGQGMRSFRKAIDKNPYVVMGNENFKALVTGSNDFNLDNIVRATQELGAESKAVLDDYHFSYDGTSVNHSGFRMTMFNLDQATASLAKGEKALKRGKKRVYVSTLGDGLGRVATLNPELLTSSNLAPYRTGNKHRIGNVGYIDLDPEIAKKHGLTEEAISLIDDIKTERDFSLAGGLNQLLPENMQTRSLQDRFELDTYHGARAAAVALETPKAHISGIPRRVREQVLMAAREKGRRKAQAMTMNLRDDSGLTRIIGSDIRRGLDEQLLAVRRFMTRGGILLDIETEGGFLESSPTRITQIAARNVNVSGIRKTLGRLTAAERKSAATLNPIMEGLAPLIYDAQSIAFGASEQATHIIELSKTLAAAAKLNTPILTQTGYDLRTLIEVGENLLRKGDGGEALSTALEVLKDIQVQHVADFTLISQLAGHKLGSLNQDALQALYGLPEEVHRAALDTAHGAALAGLMSPEVIRNLRRGGRTLDEWKKIVENPTVDKRMRYFFNNTRSPEAGVVKDLVGLYDVSTAEEDLVSAVFETVVPTKDGWIKSGKYHTVTTGVNQLGGMLHKFSQQLDPSAAPTEELLMEAGRLATSRRERMFRGLNFLTKTYWDEFGSFNAEELGAYGFHQLSVDRMALELSNRYEGKIAEYMMNRAETSPDVFIPQAYSYKAARILTKKHLRRLGIQDEDTFNRVSTRFYDIMTNPTVKSDLTDSASLYANIVSGKSAFGNTLLGLMDGDNETGVLKAQLFYMHMKNKAFAQGQEGLMKNVAYDPRLSMQLVENLENGSKLTLSRGANDLLDSSSASKIIKAQEALAGEAVLKLSEGKATGILQRFGLTEHLQQSQLSMGDMQKLATAFKEDAGAFGNNQRYMQAMSRLVDLNPSVPSEKGYAPLKGLIERMLAHEEFHRETVIAGLERTLEKQADPSGKGAELVQKAINELNERYRKIGQSTSNNKRKIAMFNKTTRSVMGRYLKNEDFRNQITANYNQIDSTQLLARMDDLTPEGLTEVFGAGGVWETAAKANGGFGAETINQAISTSRALAAKMYQEGQGEMEVHAALGELYKEVETGQFDPSRWNEKLGISTSVSELHEQGLSTQGTGTQGSNVTTQQEAINAGSRGVGESSSEVRQAHELLITEEFNAEHLARMRTPLFVAGGLLALMSLKGPTDRNFIQGNASEKMRLNPVARYSEIPGQSDIQSTWSGQSEPFRLDISFGGFIEDRRHQEKLIRSVYDSVSGSMQVTRTNTNIQDNRKDSHRQKIRELLD